MRDEYIRKFYDEVKEKLDGEYKIILEPKREFDDEWIEYDQVKWELEEQIQNLVSELLKNNNLSFEDKVLEVYKFICLNYIYDDNVLFFFKRDFSDPDNVKYIAIDWYGRIIDEKWNEKRKIHNRRVCYEFARFYAKAINELLNGDDSLEAFMLGDKENLHYVVGLTGEKYSIILDVDDFNKIKDLTRLKLGLTINGIKILRDETGVFQNAIDKFNKDRIDNLVEVEKIKEDFDGKDIIEYFKKIIDVLRKYNIDSQGFFEYMKLIVEDKEIEVEKVWKEVKGEIEKRYSGCSIFEYDGKTYLIDSVEQELNEVDIEKLDKKIFIFNPEENEYKYYGG